MTAFERGTWEQLLEALHTRFAGSNTFATWIAPITCLEDTPERLVLGQPDRFHLNWVNDHYRALFEEALASLAPNVKLEFALAPENTSVLPIPSPVMSSPLPTPSQLPMPAQALTSHLPSTSALPSRTPQKVPIEALSPMNERYTFQTFVTGPSNQLAVAAAQSVADHSGRAYNPLFVFGKVGLGKTHLVQAIGHQVKERNPGARVFYQTTENFVNDVIQGIRFERMDELRGVYRSADVLIIDDIQFIAGKEACQAEFFNTFNTLYDSKKQLIFTSDKLPHEIKDVEERVRSRFQWGLIVDLQPPELETRVAIVKKKAETDGIDLPDDVAMFIAQTIRSNVRELEGCFIRVSAYARLAKNPISMELAKQVLREVIPNRGQLTCEGIVKIVAAHFDLKVSDLKSTRRGQSIALPRQIAMYLCRSHTDASYPEIGNALGGKDHTTAINAFKRIKERADEPEVARHLEEIERVLLQ